MRQPWYVFSSRGDCVESTSCLLPKLAFARSVENMTDFLLHPCRVLVAITTYLLPFPGALRTPPSLLLPSHCKRTKPTPSLGPLFSPGLSCHLRHNSNNIARKNRREIGRFSRQFGGRSYRFPAEASIPISWKYSQSCRNIETRDSHLQYGGNVKKMATNP